MGVDMALYPLLNEEDPTARVEDLTMRWEESQVLSTCTGLAVSKNLLLVH